MRGRVLLAVAVVVVGMVGLAARPEDAVVPELLVGTLAGYAGGLAGAHFFSAAVAWAGWGTIGGALAGIVAGYVGYAVGSTLGAGLGVVLTGAALGAEGDVVFAFVGSGVGTGVAFGLGAMFDFEWALRLGAPAAAAFATWGFNQGAGARR
ncbi:MAG: hypothetical protein NUV94_06325 [Candidatus Acetothermia bacterium]|jgi:hypothetical protein|nr:hypothetical protein [Candidatus Acetothermia bacterium]